jgi:hypothetical protein
MRIIESLFPLRIGAEPRRGLRWCFALLLLGAITVQFDGCATNSQIKSSVMEESSIEESYPETLEQEIPADIQTSTEEKWGLKIVAVRLTSAGSLLDFRYRVIDPEKVSPLLDRNAKPYLVDQASGVRLSVPNMPKVGSLRAKGKPETDRVYFILFGNSRGLVKKGSKVTVVVGDFKAEDLVVE